MNPRTHCDVMVSSHEDDPQAHLYWYARVLGVFHARVLHTGPRALNRSVQRVEFLWVRWFGAEPGYTAGFEQAKLPMIGFVPDSDPEAFGFLDPSLVIRGCHLLPVFVNGRTAQLLKATHTAGHQRNETDDWTNFYVNVLSSFYLRLDGLIHKTNRFVDRDMFVRYFGGGIGHQQPIHSTINQTLETDPMEHDGGVDEDGQPDVDFAADERHRDNEDIVDHDIDGDDGGESDSDGSESVSESEATGVLSEDENSESEVEFGPEDDGGDSDSGFAAL
jgi:hypothetical protein